MRRLARELGVEAASLYHHVSGKDEILDGLVDRVSAEIELPSRTDAGGRRFASGRKTRGPSCADTLGRWP